MNRDCSLRLERREVTLQLTMLSIKIGFDPIMHPSTVIPWGFQRGGVHFIGKIPYKMDHHPSRSPQEITIHPVISRIAQCLRGGNLLQLISVKNGNLPQKIAPRGHWAIPDDRFCH